MVTQVNIGSDNGFLPDGTKPQPNIEPNIDLSSNVLWHSSESNVTQSAHELNL